MSVLALNEADRTVRKVIAVYKFSILTSSMNPETGVTTMTVTLTTVTVTVTLRL